MDGESIIIEILKNKKDKNIQVFFQSLSSKMHSGTSYCILLDLEGFFISNTFKSNLITFLDSNSERILNIAVYGVGKGVRKVILQSIEFPIYIADDKEDALDWLQS